jgi:phosphomevalonate kinase
MAEASAPGKLVVCGEYAVLHGAPAIAVAVDTRARATVRQVAGECRLSIPESGSWIFSWHRGVPRWRELPPHGQGRILEAVGAALAAHAAPVSAVLDIRLDTRDFSISRANGSQDKLGLGSSAAITVALTAALLAQAGRPVSDRAALFELCVDAHRRFQGGSGSGIDVAASVHGGVVTLTGTPAGARMRPLAWPTGLHWLAVWSGNGASTTAMLARFNGFRDSDPGRFARHAEVLHGLAAAAVGAWERSDVAAILRSLADYDDALRALDSGAGIGIYTPAHQRLAEVAGSAGAVYKISGAGGGDFGIAFADSAEVIARASAALADEGVMTLPGTAGAVGVTIQ